MKSHKIYKAFRIVRLKMGKDEDILWEIRPTRKAFLIEYLCIVFLLGMLIMNYFSPVINLPQFNYLLLGIAALIVGNTEIYRLSRHCLISDSKVLLIDGLIKQSKKHIFIPSITDVSSSQDYLQMGLNYGKIKIQSTSGEKAIEIKNVSSPEKVVDLLERLIEKSNHQ